MVAGMCLSFTIPILSDAGGKISELVLQSLGWFSLTQAPGFIIPVFQQIRAIHFSLNHPSMAALIMMF